MFIVLLGAPGSGKGTVGKELAKGLNLNHISTGDLFRENLKNETELGNKAKSYMDKGELVPDEITVEMLKAKLQDVKGDIILDGFPRNIAQANSLEKMLFSMNEKVNMALYIDVPFDEIIERIASRRTCKECQETYNLNYKPPIKEGICDKCGGALYRRQDEEPDVIKNRLKIYEETAMPLISFYEGQGTLYHAQAGDKAKKTSMDIVEDVENYFNKLEKDKR